MRGKAVCVLMIGLGLTLSACAPAPGGMEQKDGAQMLQEEYIRLTVLVEDARDYFTEVSAH